MNSPAEMRSGSRSAKTATARFAIGGDEVAQRGEERHMRQHLWLYAGAERILPDCREAGESFALLQIELVSLVLARLVHGLPHDPFFTPRSMPAGNA